MAIIKKKMLAPEGCYEIISVKYVTYFLACIAQIIFKC